MSLFASLTCVFRRIFQLSRPSVRRLTTTRPAHIDTARKRYNALYLSHCQLHYSRWYLSNRIQRENSMAEQTFEVKYTKRIIIDTDDVEDWDGMTSEERDEHVEEAAYEAFTSDGPDEVEV